MRGVKQGISRITTLQGKRSRLGRKDRFRQEEERRFSGTKPKRVLEEKFTREETTSYKTKMHRRTGGAGAIGFPVRSEEKWSASSERKSGRLLEGA